MAPSIKKLKELPSWLHTSNYDFIDTLREGNPIALLRELHVRRMLYRIALDEPDKLENNEQWVSIKATGKRSAQQWHYMYKKTKYVQCHNFEPYRNYRGRNWRRRSDQHPKLKLLIDPSGPDRLIISELKLILKEFRLKNSVEELKPDFQGSHISKIKTRKVIPYIDLMIWEKIIDSSFTSQAFADSFLPNKPANFIDKRVKPLAIEILSPGFLEEMELHT